MKKGICLSPIFPEVMHNLSALLRRLEQVADTRLFDGVELYFEGTPSQERQISKHCDALGLSMVFLGGYQLKERQLDLATPREADRAAAVTCCQQLMERGSRMGAQKLLLLTGVRGEAANDALVVSQLERSLEELLRSAPLQLTLEFFDNQKGPRRSFGSISMVEALTERVQDKNFTITFDTSHVEQLGEEITAAFERIRPSIEHLHLANCVTKDPDHPLWGDCHPLFSVPGGDFTTKDMAHFLKSISLDRVDLCSLEIITGKEQSPDWVWEQAVRQAREIWGTIL